MKNNTDTLQAGERTQHTPGPWTIAASSHGIEWSHWIESGTPTSKRLVAAVAIDNLRDGPEEANARLIAAAPELLEALKELLKINAISAVVNIRAPSAAYTKVLKARAVISKAEGNS